MSGDACGIGHREQLQHFLAQETITTATATSPSTDREILHLADGLPLSRRVNAGGA